MRIWNFKKNITEFKLDQGNEFEAPLYTEKVRALCAHLLTSVLMLTVL